MQSEKPKVRSDYHELFSSLASSAPHPKIERWIKITLLLGLGFMLGIFYTKFFLISPAEVLALSTPKDGQVVIKKASQGLDKTAASSKA